MPCDLAYQQQLKQEERERIEREREDALTEIERSLGAGTAALVRQPDGTWALEGVPLPQGMHDSCVLASLERRASANFIGAVAMAGATDAEFVTAHNHSHGW